MKKIYTIAWTVLALLAISCSKDLGNYDFKPEEVIKIEGLEKSYTKTSGVDRLVIDPTLSSTEGSSDFDCFWGVYETNVIGYTPKMDTISKAKSLDYLVTQRANNNWVLVFCAKNRKTGVAQYTKIPLKVTTPTSGGWFVLKDDGSQSDIDLFKTPTGIIPTTKVENMFSYYNGKKIAGRASFFGYSTDYRAAEFGTFEGTKTLFAGTDKDVSAISINSFKELKNLDGLFYEKPTVKAPGMLMNPTSSDYFLINDGQLHGLYMASLNSGLFSSRKLLSYSGGVQNAPYKLSKYFVGSANFTGSYFFDELGSSFLNQSDAYSNSLTTVNDIGLLNGKPQTAMTAKNNNKKLLFMAGTYAYFQDKTDANLKILSNLTLSTTAFKMVNDTVKTTQKFFNATNIALNLDENMVYFVNGNEVWSRNLSSKAELQQFVPPAGEVITFIKHRKYVASPANGPEAPWAHNYVMIGTTKGGNYKVYMFEKSAGNFMPLGNPTPKFLLEGTGSVGDVFYLR